MSKRFKLETHNRDILTALKIYKDKNKCVTLSFHVIGHSKALYLINMTGTKKEIKKIKEIVKGFEDVQ